MTNLFFASFQVSQILRTNQFSIDPNFEPIKRIECNQLASNSPIEDRIRIAKLQYDSFKQINNKKEPAKDSFIFAVIDGHGGETCADIVADRLFSYLAMSMFNFKSTHEKLIEPISLDYLRSLPLEKFKHIKKKVLNDQFVMPKLFDAQSSSYRSHHLEALEDLIIEEEKENLIRFAEELETKPVENIEEAIHRSFMACDIDLSNEIKRNITNPKSNIALHYYLSLAASGCCVNLILIDGQDGFVASSGDCKAILGINNEQLDMDESRLVHLSIEHDSDNINEVRRIMSEHPKEEHNSILKSNRLLGRLMPLRAFGDFSYKWTADEMKMFCKFYLSTLFKFDVNNLFNFFTSNSCIRSTHHTATLLHTTVLDCRTGNYKILTFKYSERRIIHHPCHRWPLGTICERTPNPEDYDQTQSQTTTK